MPACADMAVASFEELCAGFCEIAGVPTPALVANANGLIAFHMVLRDVTVNVIHSPEKCAGHAFILFDLGPVGQDDADSSRGLQTLLHANFLQLQVHPPMYSRNPKTGDVVLQFVYPFFEATPNGLFDLIDSGVNLALRWREHVLRPKSSADGPAAAARPPAMLLGFA